MAGENNVIPFDRSAMPPAIAAAFNAEAAKQELSGGVAPSFAVLSYRGKAWRITSKGDQKPLRNKDGEAVTSLEIVLVKASESLSKIYYEQGYEEGSNDAPDCYSNDGVKPDAGAPKKQAAVCATCPMNEWGSQITDQGKKAKACSDSRRMAAVPAGDIDNEALGGPMLLRVPPASLQELAAYGNRLASEGWPYFGVATRVSFDIEASYPKLTFRAVRPLTEEEAGKVIQWRDSDEAERILGGVATTAPAEAAAEPEATALFEEPPAEIEAPKEKAKPKAKPKAKAAEPEPVKASDEEPEATADAPEDVEKMLGSLLGSLGGDAAE